LITPIVLIYAKLTEEPSYSQNDDEVEPGNQSIAPS